MWKCKNPGSKNFSPESIHLKACSALFPRHRPPHSWSPPWTSFGYAKGQKLEEQLLNPLWARWGVTFFSWQWGVRVSLTFLGPKMAATALVYPSTKASQAGRKKNMGNRTFSLIWYLTFYPKEKYFLESTRRLPHIFHCPFISLGHRPTL